MPWAVAHPLSVQTIGGGDDAVSVVLRNGGPLAPTNLTFDLPSHTAVVTGDTGMGFEGAATGAAPIRISGRSSEYLTIRFRERVCSSRLAGTFATVSPDVDGSSRSR